MKKPTPKRRRKTTPHSRNDAERELLMAERARIDKLRAQLMRITDICEKTVRERKKLEKKLKRVEADQKHAWKAHDEKHERITSNHTKILRMAGPSIETIQRACEMQRTILHGLRFNIDGEGVGLTVEATIAQLQLAIKLINQVLLFRPESGTSHDPNLKSPIGHEVVSFKDQMDQINSAKPV